MKRHRLYNMVISVQYSFMGFVYGNMLTDFMYSTAWWLIVLEPGILMHVLGG